MEVEWLSLTDDLGPSHVLLIHDALVGLEAIAVVDNTARGPAIGGVRMSRTVGVQEVARLARAMTLKSAAAGLPYGGCKSGIIADPSLGPAEKELLMRSFARAIRGLTELIPGPDMGTDERCMAYVHDEIGRAVGLPRSIGGIPLDEIGATGFGISVCAAAAADRVGIRLSDARVTIQGFGAVGKHSARCLAERGTTVVAVSDSLGGVFNPDGLDVDALLAHKAGGSSVHEFDGGTPVSHEQMLPVDCEIWVPAAQPDVIRSDNVLELAARMVVPGANIACTPEAETILHERNVVVIPDYIANAGGLIAAAVEHRGGTESEAFQMIEEKIDRNTQEVLDGTTAGTTPREAADRLALARVRDAMSYRRRGLGGAEKEPATQAARGITAEVGG